MSKGEWCQNCHEASTCTKEIIGYKRFTFEGKPYGKLFETEDEAWDTNGKPYNGEFEVYPICR